jgi:hypothetical protein
MALADAMAESPLLTIFSSSPTFSDSSLTFELVDWTNLFAFSRAEHNYQKTKVGKVSNMVRIKKNPFFLEETAFFKQLEGVEQDNVSSFMWSSTCLCEKLSAVK